MKGPTSEQILTRQSDPRTDPLEWRTKPPEPHDGRVIEAQDRNVLYTIEMGVERRLPTGVRPEAHGGSGSGQQSL
jgi:hypothetical protein